MNKNIFRKIFAAYLVIFLVAAFATGCSRDPNVRKQKYLESGKRYFQKGKYREAAIQFGNALRIDSNFPDAHYQLAICDLKLGSAQAAYNELSRTVALQPDNMQAELDLGNLLLVARQPEKASERADYVLSKDPGNIGAHVLKGDADAEMRQVNQAIAEMTTAVQLDPTRSASYLNLAVIEAAKASESPAAEANFKKAIELDSKAIPARLQLAAFYDRNKRSSEAEQQLKDAVKLAPVDQQVRTALVAHYLQVGQKDLAETAAKEAKSKLQSDPNGAQFLARYYLATNNKKSATAEYQALAQQFPKERQIQHAYIQLLMSQEQGDAALKQIDLLLKRFPKDSQALTDKGLLLNNQGKASEARDVLQSVVKADPQNVVAFFALGNSFKALGDTGQAESAWRQATQVQPAYLPAQRALADLALSKKNFSSLAQIAKTLKDKVPNVADGYEIQAEVDASNNDAKSAEQNLHKAISINPKSSDLYVQLGRLLMVLHRDAEAENTLDQALQIDPQQTQALRALAQLYSSQKRPAKAVARAKEMVAQYPDNGQAHFILGQLAASQKDLEEAENELSRAAQLMPNNLDVYTALASVQLARNEIPQTKATYETAVQKNPKDSGAYWLLGTFLDQQRDVKDAEQNYRKALDLKPDLGVAANNLAYLMLENGGNIDQVITYAEIARRQFPNSPAVADTLGWAYCQKGTPGLALEMLEDAVKGSPNTATYHYHLGMIYSKLGNRNRAKGELQKALQLETVQSKKEEMRKSLASLS